MLFILFISSLANSFFAFDKKLIPNCLIVFISSLSLNKFNFLPISLNVLFEKSILPSGFVLFNISLKTLLEAEVFIIALKSGIKFLSSPFIFSFKKLIFSFNDTFDC